MKHIKETQRENLLWLLASHLVTTAKMRSRKIKTPFDISVEWVFEKLLSGVCEASGIPLELETVRAKHQFQPSLDQIYPGEGYTKNNVRVVCLIYNYAKMTFKHEDVVRFVTEFKLK